MPTHICAHCGVEIAPEDAHRRTASRTLSSPVKTRGLLDPPGRRQIARSYVVEVVELICRDCQSRAQEEAEALEHFHKVFVAIIGVICLVFIVCMSIPPLRTRIVDFIHPDESIYATD